MNLREIFVGLQAGAAGRLIFGEMPSYIALLRFALGGSLLTLADLCARCAVHRHPC